MLIFLAGEFFSNFFLIFFIEPNAKAICSYCAAA